MWCSIFNLRDDSLWLYLHSTPSWEEASPQKEWENTRKENYTVSIVLSTCFTPGCERNGCWFFFIREIISWKINRVSLPLSHSFTRTHIPQPPWFPSNTPDRRSLLFAHTPWPYLDTGKKRAHMIVYGWQQGTVGAWLTGVAVGSRTLNANAINQPNYYQHWYIFQPYGVIFHICWFSGLMGHSNSSRPYEVNFTEEMFMFYRLI